MLGCDPGTSQQRRHGHRLRAVRLNRLAQQGALAALYALAHHSKGRRDRQRHAGNASKTAQKIEGYRPANLNHPRSQPTQVVIDASPSGATSEGSQPYQRPLPAKRDRTIAQTPAPKTKRPKTGENTATRY